MKSPKERFLAKVDSTQDCWLWQDALSPSGYGTFHMNGKNHRAHRISYLLFVGEIPKGHFVCHHCDNPRCVNPKHLFTGTNSDNMKDSGKKGRHWSTKHREKITAIMRRIPRAQGEKHGRAKLTNKDALFIKNTYIKNSSGKTSALFLANKFKVSKDTIQKIGNGQLWASLQNSGVTKDE